MPDIRQDRQAWFRFFDEDGSGSLDKEEVTRGLVKSFRLADSGSRASGSAQAPHTLIREFKDLVDCVWPCFDTDGSGDIEQNEFLAPGDGLADAIIASYGH